MSSASSGRLTCLTLFTPLRRRWVPVLRVALWAAKWVDFAQRHILQFRFIHFVRWAIVRPLPYSGPPQPRDALRHDYLFFESNFDGPWEDYINAFAYCIPADIRFVWGAGFDFPSPPPAEPLKQWIARNAIEGGTYYCAYPDASTRMVEGALATRDAMRPLVAAAAMASPDEFRQRYEQMLTDCQAHL